MQHTRVKIRTLAPLVILLVLVSTVAAQDSTKKAWQMLESGAAAEKPDDRATAVRVLGLLTGDSRAVKLAEKALQDPDEKVRAAGATALGQMDAKSSDQKLRAALKDDDVSVVMAAAHALHALGDPTAYEVYYAVLTGERKSGEGLLEKQKKMLKDPKKMAQFGFEQGLGFVPFASLGYGVIKAVRKDDVSPVRAGAAKVLAADPDPRSGKALEDAAFDNSWVVRVAALDAIARRGDPSLRKAAESAMTDDNAAVRFTAAATVVRLSTKSKDAGQ